MKFFNNFVPVSVSHCTSKFICQFIINNGRCIKLIRFLNLSYFVICEARWGDDSLKQNDKMINRNLIIRDLRFIWLGLLRLFEGWGVGCIRRCSAVISALHLGITPDGLNIPFGILEIISGSAACKASTLHTGLIVKLFVCFGLGVKPDSAQKLLLDLYLGITSGGLSRSYGMPGN